MSEEAINWEDVAAFNKAIFEGERRLRRKAEQERDALREALKQIAEHEMSFGADGYTISARCKDIARAALEAKP